MAINENTIKVLFLVNPKAGIGSKHHILELLNNTVGFDYEVTKYPGHIKELFKDKRNDYELFVAVGGDGTVNELVSAAVNTDVAIAALPYGSGNGFAREFGFRKNIKRLLNDIQDEEFLWVDSLSINGHVSVNVSGVGFDSKIAHIFHNMKKRGFWSYFFTTLKAILLMKSFYAEIRTDNNYYKGRFFLVTAANNKQYGNNAIISPNANPFDGKFELLMFKPFPKILFPYFAINIFLGSLRQSKYVKYIQHLKQIEINTPFKQFHIDGEAIELASPVKIEIMPRSVKVLKSRKYK